MTLKEFLEAQIKTRGWTKMDLVNALRDIDAGRYAKHQGVYAWFKDGNGISKTAALHVADVFALDQHERRVFAVAAGFGEVVDLLHGADEAA